MAGVDVGLESFATLSNGEKIPNPRFFREEEHELARVQRRLSKAQKGTPERRSALKVVQRVHERIANKRYEFAHQVSHNLVDRFGLLADPKNTSKMCSRCGTLVEKSLSDRVHNCP